MRIIGGVTKQEVNVNSAHDHRIVMAAAAMAIGANTNVTIEHAEAVKKSFPDFFDILENTGVKVSLT
jgi:3-phosphoshikimate 1-carboxyvinyltransferase